MIQCYFQDVNLFLSSFITMTFEMRLTYTDGDRGVLPFSFYSRATLVRA